MAYLDPRVCCLVADREFIGREWFAFLLEQQVDFVIRLRGNTSLTLDDGRRRYGATFNARMPRGTTRSYPQTTLYDGLTLNLVCHRPIRGERILLITNRTDLKQVLAVYGQRWAIETTFACLKSRGFNLEDTHLTHPQRLHLLLGLLAWTLLWALLVGRRFASEKTHPHKKTWTTSHKPLSKRIRPTHTDHTPSTRPNLNATDNINTFYCRVLSPLTLMPLPCSHSVSVQAKLSTRW